MTHPNPTVRYDTVTARGTVPCAWCATPLTPTRRRRFCSGACKQAHWRARHTQAPEPATIARPDHTIYECPTCAQRYLGTQRCPDCNTFCHRIGPGGLCPHCDEPVAHTDLDQQQPHGGDT
jgi:hypothetical protein